MEQTIRGNNFHLSYTALLPAFCSTSLIPGLILTTPPSLGCAYEFSVIPTYSSELQNLKVFWELSTMYGQKVMLVSVG